MTFKSLAAAAGLAMMVAGGPVLAQDATEITRDALYAGTLEEGRSALAPLAEAGDEAALFGQGLIGFAQALEGMAQAMYRHGLAAPDTGPLMPALGVPAPANPNPEPLDYATLRAILERFVEQLDAAGVILEQAGVAGDYVMLLDPMAFRLDIDGDGIADETEALGLIVAQASGLASPGPQGRPVTPPSRGDEEGGELDVLDTTIGFDRADAFWLAGYSNVLAAQADFLLAHDFSLFVDATFHRLFPHAGLPMQEFARGGSLVLDPDSDTAIADLIAAIHTLNWPVEDPDRLRGVLERAKRVIDLSRRNWEAILAETDDQRELVPNPDQTAIVPEAVVTDEVVAAWRETLDVAEQVLDGELLVPHWRFRQGFHLKAYFETATRTDLMMLLTGYDALPFLREGPVATAESFAAANRVFGNDLLGYVFWFN